MKNKSERGNLAMLGNVKYTIIASDAWMGIRKGAVCGRVLCRKKEWNSRNTHR